MRSRFWKPKTKKQRNKNQKHRSVCTRETEAETDKEWTGMESGKGRQSWVDTVTWMWGEERSAPHTWPWPMNDRWMQSQWVVQRPGCVRGQRFPNSTRPSLDSSSLVRNRKMKWDLYKNYVSKILSKSLSNLCLTLQLCQRPPLGSWEAGETLQSGLRVPGREGAGSAEGPALHPQAQEAHKGPLRGQGR